MWQGREPLLTHRSRGRSGFPERQQVNAVSDQSAWSWSQHWRRSHAVPGSEDSEPPAFLRDLDKQKFLGETNKEVCAA